MTYNWEGNIKKRFEHRIRIIRYYARQPRRWILPWYIGYGMLGIISNGLIPVLLPLLVTDHARPVSWIGLVVGSFNLGLLTAVVWGKQADKYHIYKPVFIGGFIILTGVCTVIAFVESLWLWMILSFAAGVSIAAVSTIATLFVVEVYPKKEWGPRIAWLQTFYGSGQVIGLLLAGALVARIDTGFIASAIILLPALWFGRMGIPAIKTPQKTISVSAQKHPKIPDFHFSGSFTRIEHQSNIHYFPFKKMLTEILKIGKSASSPFGRFLFSWFVLAFGIAAFFAYFPVTLREAYDIPPYVTALTYGISAGAAIGLYLFGAKLSGIYGSGRVYRWALILRLTGFAILLIVFFLPIHKIYPALAGFSFTVIAWPLISIAGTDMAVRLSTASEGETMGLLNTTAAIATVAGSFLSGALIELGGESALSAMAILGVGAAWISAGGLDDKKPIAQS